MTDMRKAIAPKSDQMNYDDFLIGEKTIVITDVKISDNSNEQQPVTVYYQGDDGKPYKPCKSMCRVMVRVWGSDASKYIGKSMTLFGDPSVIWGGQKVGGIRISNMSHIDKEFMVPLSASKTKRLLYRISPLKVDTVDDGTQQASNVADYSEIYHRAQGQAHQGTGAYKDFFSSLNSEEKRRLTDNGDHEKLKKIAEDVDEDAPVNENENDIGKVDDPFEEHFGDTSQQQEESHDRSE